MILAFSSLCFKWTPSWTSREYTKFPSNLEASDLKRELTSVIWRRLEPHPKSCSYMY